jgi:hypothetical protein
MNKVLTPRRVRFIFIFALISGLFNSCSKQDESAEITTFLQDLPTRIVGLAFDSEANMYTGTIEDQPQKSILRITHDGEISTLISFQCFAIEYIKAAKDDSLYVSAIIDNVEGGAKIFKITRDAKISLFSDGFTQPVGMTFDLEGNLMVVDAMTKKVYKISPSKEKSVFIDLGNITDVPQGNYYHGIDFDRECRNLFIAGLNTSGKGNLLKFPIKADGTADNPEILSDHYAKHVTTHNNTTYSTIDDNSLLVIQKNGSQKTIKHSLLAEGMNLSFGRKDFGENTLYVNTFERIVKVIW